MKKFVMAAVAATMTIAAPSVANATTFIPITTATTGNTTSGAFAAINIDPGAFTHTFNFMTSLAGTISSAVVTIELTGFNNVTFSGIDLDGQAFTPEGGTSDDWRLFNASLASGPHTFTLIGTETGIGGSYAGQFSIAGVPEPMTWGLMVAGFGMMGMAMRRRRTSAASVLA